MSEGAGYDDAVTCRPVWSRRRGGLRTWLAYTVEGPTAWAPANDERLNDAWPRDDAAVAGRPRPAFLEYLGVAELVVPDRADLDRIRRHLGAVTIAEIVDRALELYLDELRDGFRAAAGVDPEDLRRFAPARELWLLAGGDLRAIAIAPDVVEEAYALTLDPAAREAIGFASVVRDALARYAAFLEERAAADVPGSAAPPVRPFRAAPVPGALPLAEVRAALRAWRAPRQGAR